eukprot:788841_1
MSVTFTKCKFTDKLSLQSNNGNTNSSHTIDDRTVNINTSRGRDAQPRKKARHAHTPEQAMFKALKNVKMTSKQKPTTATTESSNQIARPKPQNKNPLLPPQNHLTRLLDRN